MGSAINVAYFHVQYTKKNVSIAFRNLNLDEPERVSVPPNGQTMTRRILINSIAYGLIYYGKQLLCLKDSKKVFNNYCLVSPYKQYNCSNIKRLAGCRFTLRFGPKQTKSRSPLNFTFSTLQSNFTGGKIRECKCVDFVSKSPTTSKATNTDAYKRYHCSGLL